MGIYTSFSANHKKNTSFAILIRIKSKQQEVGVKGVVPCNLRAAFITEPDLRETFFLQGISRSSEDDGTTVYNKGYQEISISQSMPS